MKIIMSLWTKPCTDGKSHGFRSVEEMIESLILSVNVAKKHYPDIHFYTDKLGYEWITPHLDQLPFTKIEVCLDDFNWVPDVYWSFVKVYVYTLQKEPFIHIDNDVFLWDKIPEYILEDKDFVFQETEPMTWGQYDFYNRGLKIYSHAVHKDIEIKDIAVNCGIFACLTDAGLKLLDDYYEYGKCFVENADLKKADIDKEPNSERWLASVIIEQVYIYSLIVRDNLKWDTLLNEERNSYRMRYSHMVAHFKRQELIVNRIKERILLKKWN
jgi:hypothetical protein